MSGSTARATRLVATVIGLALLGCVGSVRPPAAPVGIRASRLFVIERSVNANIVVYDAVQVPGGALDAGEPVVAYWLLNAERGQRQELSLIESLEAYGFQVAHLPDGKVQMKLHAFATRPVTVEVVEAGPRAVTVIAGQDAVLSRIRVQTRTGSSLDVEHIDLLGQSIESGAPVLERLSRSKQPL